MSYQELTPAWQSGYDGYMEPTVPERPTSQESGVKSAPLSAAARSLIENAENGNETEKAPVDAQTDGMSVAKKELSKQKKLTRDNLIEVAQSVQGKNSVSDVLIDAQFVRSAAKILRHNIEADVKNRQVNEPVLKELESKGIFRELDELEKFLSTQRPDGELTEDESTATRERTILSKAPLVARLAEAVANYYKKATLSKEYNDPFKQIVSFEELMTNFNITLEDDQFKPGGEFSLLDIREYVDDFGREMSQETAHPENFLRWVDKKLWFYHDFDPMAPIKQFEGMYIVAGTRKISMYEMLVDFPSYFAHRIPTQGELKVLQSDLGRAAQNPDKYQPMPPRNDEHQLDDHGQQVVGFYKNIETIDRETGKKIIVEKAWVSANAEEDRERNAVVLPVYYYNEKGEHVSVMADLAAKEQWQTVSPKNAKEFERAQEEILYRVWLMGENHNYDVMYRQKGMPSETPLKETLAEINADNKFTRTRRRLWAILDMPTTTHREEDIVEEKDEKGNVIYDKATGKPKYRAVWRPSEAHEKFVGSAKGQGTLGKAVQRSLAAYYHISEANAEFNEYSLEEGRNPFFEVLEQVRNDERGTKDVRGAEVFYKSLIRRNLLEDAKFGYVEKGYDADSAPEKCRIEVEFFNELNKTKIPRTGKMADTQRNRFEWEKADFVDFMTLNQTDFIRTMRDRSITAKNMQEAFDKLQATYKNNPQRLAELDALWQRTATPSAQRKAAFLDNLQAQVGTFTKLDDKYKKFSERYKGSNSLEALSAYAVALFTKSFPPEFSPDINPYGNIRYSLEARERMRTAMRDTLSFTERLDEFDAKWAEEWAYTFTFHTGISARNDMGGIGHDAWSKIQNTEFYRLRQSGGGNYPGNLDNLYGLHRLGTNFWEGLKVQEDGSDKYEKTLYEELVGLEKYNGGYRFNINKDMKGFEFAGNAQRQFFADHVSHAIDLFIDITQKHEFNFDKLVKEDNMGRVTINHAEMQKMIDTTWKHLRYGFDNNGMLYGNTLYGWWYDESFNEDGQVSRKPHFGFKTLRDLMFSKEVQAMDMYKRKDVSGWADTPSNNMTKMARNVFAYLIKAQLEEHTKRKGEATLYNADQVSLLVQAFMTYSARVMRGEHAEAIVLSGFFTPEEMFRITMFAHAILWKLYAKEYGKDALGGFFAAILQAMSIMMKEVGGSINLKAA